MADQHTLDCHPATDQERTLIYQNVFPVWPHADTLEEHVQLRLASAQHNHAAWFVGCVGAEVVVSLGCYPLRFHVRNQFLKGMAIGAVHTNKSHRGQGFAPRLLNWVEQYQAQQDCELSLLFSDISPEYYARFGYTACTAMEGWITVEEIPTDQQRLIMLEVFDPHTELDSLRELYDSHHQHLEVSIARDSAHWNFLIAKSPPKEFYWCLDSQSIRRGYLAVSSSGSTLQIEDFSMSVEDHALMLTAVIELARDRGFQRIGGWLPDQAEFAKRFSLTPRNEEITMMKWINCNKNIDLKMQQAAGGIHEVDHV